ncbi:hypothetical protein A7D00_3654 [Trichophyton violaceum]|uniref:Amidoligase enzyme n=1 Tax=Trichophyton violaceum TaxID=34388 RepID=A0A178FJ77_TRIVO|nr:hypothetical protein A7D00_3654 [Trichophyton violaceum]
METNYKIGIEVELFLQPNDNVYTSKEDFAKELVSSYRQIKENVHLMHLDLDECPYFGPNRLTEWTMEEDCSLETDRPGQIDAEFSSPVMYHSNPLWRRSVGSVFKHLRTLASLQVNHSCGFHVHISKQERPWTLEDLKRVSRAILYFESSIELVVPEHRRGSIWGKNNCCDNPRFEGKSDKASFDLVDACTNNVELVQLMNSGNNRNYGWNFTNLLEGDNYTVELRRGPGLTAEIDAFRWVEFVVRFINSARNIGTRWGLSQYRRDVLGLHKFLCDYPVPNSNPNLLEPLFAGKTGVLEPRRLGQLTPEQARRLRDKDDEAKNKNTIKEKWSLIPM